VAPLLDNEIDRLRYENSQLREQLGARAPPPPEPVSVVKEVSFIYRCRQPSGV
jgi:hypothetical protein